MSKDYQKYLFLILSAVLIAPIWFFEYFPTWDGPSHLANAVLVRRLLTGECGSLNRLYHFTPSLVPNWITHVFMAVLTIFIKPLIVEKLVLTTCMIMYLLSLLVLIRRINSASYFMLIPLSIFAYNNLLFGGNYNCIFSIAVFFLMLSYWLPRRYDYNIKNFALLSLSLIFLYFCHFFGLAAFCLTTGVIYIVDFLAKPNSSNFKKLFKSAAFEIAAVIPCLIMFWQYVNLPKVAVDGTFPLSLKLTELFSINLIYFSHYDAYLVQIFTCLFWILILLILFHRISTRKSFSRNDWPLFLSIILAIAVIFTPSTFAGGWMIEIRLELLYWIFLLIWVASHSFNKTAKIFVISISSVFLIVSFANKFYYYQKYNKIMHSFAQVEPHIPNNSTIFTVDISTYTIDYATGEKDYRMILPNMTGYITSDRCIVEVANFHAAEKNTFPISYKDEYSPYLHLGRFRTLNSLIISPPDVNIANYEKTTGVKIDYVVIRGAEKYMYHYSPEDGLDEKKLYKDFMAQVNAEFDLQWQSDDGLVKLYKRKA